MFNNQDFVELNDVVVKDQDQDQDQDRLINGLKWSHGYFDDHAHLHHHHTSDNIHVQIVPEIYEEEENLEKDLLVSVPDEQSETGHDHLHHLHKKEDDSDSSNNRCYLRSKDRKLKRRRIQISSDEESSEGFTREVPSVTTNISKRIKRRDEIMSDKMRTLQQLVPNCYKKDKVSVLDKTIEYMKNLQLQLKVMSIMGMNPYIPPVTLNFGMHINHLLTAHGQNPANQTTSSSSPLLPPSNWPLPPFTNLSLSPHSSNQSLYGLVPFYPSFLDFTMGRF